MSKKRRTIFVFGNPRVKEDSLPLRILPKLRERFPGIQFIEADPTEVLNYDKDVWILDSAKGISEVTLLEDLSSLVPSKSTTPHDYDLMLDLTLLKKIGKLPKLKIIALPYLMSEEAAIQGITQLLAHKF